MAGLLQGGVRDNSVVNIEHHMGSLKLIGEGWWEKKCLWVNSTIAINSPVCSTIKSHIFSTKATCSSPTSLWSFHFDNNYLPTIILTRSHHNHISSPHHPPFNHQPNSPPTHLQYHYSFRSLHRGVENGGWWGREAHNSGC